MVNGIYDGGQSESRRLIPIKMGIVTAKEKAFESVRIIEDLLWNPLALAA